MERLNVRMDGKWNEYQHGFREGKCTEDVWMRLREWKEQSKRKYVCGVFVDFKGAFDNLR